MKPDFPPEYINQCSKQNLTERDAFSVSDTGGLEEKIRVLPIGVEPLITLPDPLSLSYRRFGDSKPCCYRNLFRSPAAMMLFQLASLICLTL